MSPSGNLPCAWCEGARPGHGPPFLDLSPRADWMGTIFQPPMADAPSSHPIWTIPGVTLFSTTQDPMRCVDLGVTAHFVGSCLWTLVYDGRLPGNAEARMGALWIRIHALYGDADVSTRLSSLPISFFCDPTRPHMSYPCMTTKAAENRSLLPMVAQLCREFGEGSPRDNARVRAAEALEAVYTILRDAGHFLKPEEHAALVEACFRFTDAYSRLSADAARRGVLCWNVVNKVHMLIHLALCARYLNPNSTWAYPFRGFGRADEARCGREHEWIAHASAPEYDLLEV